MICDSAHATRWRSWSGRVQRVHEELLLQLEDAVHVALALVGRARLIVAVAGRRGVVGRRRVLRVGAERPGLPRGRLRAARRVPREGGVRRLRLVELVVDPRHHTHRLDAGDLGGRRTEGRLLQEPCGLLVGGLDGAASEVERPVAAHAERELDARRAVGRAAHAVHEHRGGGHVPRAVAEDDEVVRAVAVVVEDQRHVAAVACAAEAVGAAHRAGAAERHVPEPVAVQDEVLDPVAVHVAEQRDVPCLAAERHLRGLPRGHVQEQVDAADARDDAVDDELVLAVAVDVGDQRLVADAAVQDRLVDGTVTVGVEMPEPAVVGRRRAHAGACDVGQQADVARGAEGDGQIGPRIEVAVDVERRRPGAVQADRRRARLRVGGRREEHRRYEQHCHRRPPRRHRGPFRTTRSSLQHGLPRLRNPLAVGAPRRAVPATSAIWCLRGDGGATEPVLSRRTPAGLGTERSRPYDTRIAERA